MEIHSCTGKKNEYKLHEKYNTNVLACSLKCINCIIRNQCKTCVRLYSITIHLANTCISSVCPGLPTHNGKYGPVAYALLKGAAILGICEFRRGQSVVIIIFCHILVYMLCLIHMC